MTPEPTTLLRLSQTQLNVLAACPRKFQHLYLEQLGAPLIPDEQTRMQQGAQFHLLVQQWLLTLPIAPLVASDPALHQWFDAFQGAAPDILALADPQAQRSPECDRTLEFQGYLLTARYDLLLTTPHQAKILDWKTYARPRDRRWLATNWQTRLYPFILAETSAYTPADIELIYWFFQTPAGAPDTPQSLTFAYSAQQHEQTRADLTQLLQALTVALHDYEQGQPLPDLPFGAESCNTCAFARRCDRDPEPSANAPQAFPTPLPAWSEIEEIPL